ncbi:MAG: glycosyltransferase family 4 protein [Actinomycetota bacterium]
MSAGELSIALLTYRGNPHSGGQGVYVRYLSRALTDLGHRVEVFAGPPYPELHQSVALTKVPSLDLYRPDALFRRPKRSEYRDVIDIAEYAMMRRRRFPEPLTFSLRVARALTSRASEFDVAHDNQCLGYGLLRLKRGLPVLATIHHPISIDRDLALADAPDANERKRARRWYGFTTMQGRVARRLPRIVAVSGAARDDVVRKFRVQADRIAVVHHGVDADLFRPVPDVRPIPGRIVTTASSAMPLKGLVYLIEAMAKLSTEKEASLVVVGSPDQGGPVADAIARYDLEHSVTFRSGIPDRELVAEYARAEVAVVPSLYEGFCLPAIEAMSSAVPLVTTTAGALPEVVGPDGDCSLHVPPGDAGALAITIARLLDDPDLRARLAARGRERATTRYTWRAAAQATVDAYRAIVC